MSLIDEISEPLAPPKRTLVMAAKYLVNEDRFLDKETSAWLMVTEVRRTASVVNLSAAASFDSDALVDRTFAFDEQVTVEKR